MNVCLCINIWYSHRERQRVRTPAFPGWPILCHSNWRHCLQASGLNISLYLGRRSGSTAECDSLQTRALVLCRERRVIKMNTSTFMAVKRTLEHFWLRRLVESSISTPQLAPVNDMFEFMVHGDNTPTLRSSSVFDYVWCIFPLLTLNKLHGNHRLLYLHLFFPCSAALSFFILTLFLQVFGVAVWLQTRMELAICL